MKLSTKKMMSTTELANILGVSHVTIFNKIKKGEIKAEKVGRNYVIKVEDVSEMLGEELSDKSKTALEKAVKRVIEEYGETLRLLGEEE